MSLFFGNKYFSDIAEYFHCFSKTFDYQFVDFIRMRSIVCFTVFCFFTNKASIERYSLNWLLGLGVGVLSAGLLYWKKYHTPVMQGSFERNKPMLKRYRNYALWAFIGANIGNVF